jgi:ribosomal protein S18 acetylase RimI-like enzyme
METWAMTRNDIEIRPAAASEQAEVVALWRAAGLTRPWNDPDRDFELAVAGPASTVLVARTGGALAGAAVIGHDGHRGAIYYLGVDAAQRRRGIGAALVHAAEDWCRAAGVPKLNLLVRNENAGVLAFYAALGYADTKSVSLYRTLDEVAAERERMQKQEWAARLVE